MNTQYEIVRYRPSHKQAVAQLVSELTGGSPSLAGRYLEWKYEQNPYVSEPNLYLAFSGTTLAGVRGFYGARWESGRGASRVVTSVSVADDMVIAPEHRNRGLITLIMREAFADLARRGHQYAFNLSGGQVTVMASLAMGWKSVGALQPVGLKSGPVVQPRSEVLKRTRFLWRFAESHVFRSRDERQPFHRLDQGERRRTDGPVRVEREPRLDAMSDLVERLGHDGRIRHVRDREFLAWRFRNPLTSYRFLYVGGERLEGFLVLQSHHPSRRHPPKVRIVDLEGTSARVRAELLDAAIGPGNFPELFTWATALPASAFDHLTLRGFVPVDLQARSHGCPCVLVRAVSPAQGSEPWALGDRSLTDPRDWDLRMIDTMAG